MENAIIIKQSYFNGIKAAIDSLNEFFSSGFEVKNFPILEEDYEIDPTIERIVSRLDAVDPTWLKDESKFNDIVETLNEELAKIDPVDGIYETIVNSNNEALISSIDSYVGLKVLQVIADNFNEFSTLLNGIYTFEIFTIPSKYSEIITLFSQFVQFNEVPDLDLEEKIFDEGFYVDGIFKNGMIEIPEDLTIESETERIINRQDLTGYQVYVDDEADTVQEAAEVNFFADDKPAHMKYSTKTRKFMVSKEFKATVDEFIKGLRGCNSTDDLKGFLSQSNKTFADKFSRTVAPYIVVKALTNPNKANVDFDKNVFKKYLDSYSSILSQNNGARRFENYDIYSTFKTDKDGTIKFIEDFFKLDLINQPDASISNNTLLTLFNIFDSRIYLDIAYNIAPDDIKNNQTENQFVTSIRGTINKNSRTNNTYTKKEDDEASKEAAKNEEEETKSADESTQTAHAETPETPEKVSEYVVSELNKFGDMTISDMMYCEHFHDILHAEIETLDSRLYNMGISPLVVNEFIGESFDVIENSVYQEATTEENRDRLNRSIAAVIADMKKIESLSNKKLWTNNACISMFKKSEVARANLTQAIKYCNRAIATAAGKLDSSQQSAIKDFRDKLKLLLRTVKHVMHSPFIGKNIKDSEAVRNIATAAKELIAKESSLEFLKAAPVHDTSLPSSKKDEEISESFVMPSFEEFIMEASPLDVPAYMKKRFKDYSDDIPASPTPVDVPEGIPTNSVDDLADSIDAKIDSSDNLDDMLGSGFENANGNKKNGSIVVNITNNYTNSFNKGSYNQKDDHSTGKTTNIHNTNSHNTTNSNNNKGNDKGSNNNNNSNGSVDTKDSKSSTKKDDKIKLSSGKTIQEMFMIMESKEPQSSRANAGDPPKETLLTKAYDRDKDTLAKQQKAKRGVQTAGGTVKMIFKPIGRAKNWLTGIVDSLIKRDEDAVKAELTENRSYRSAVYKAMRLAIHTGLIGVAFSIQPWLGVTALGVEGARLADRNRVRKELRSELETELKILDKKIEALDERNPKEAKMKYQLMRLKGKTEKDLIHNLGSPIKSNNRDTYSW